METYLNDVCAAASVEIAMQRTTRRLILSFNMGPPGLALTFYSGQRLFRLRLVQLWRRCQPLIAMGRTEWTMGQAAQVHREDLKTLTPNVVFFEHVLPT